MVTTDPRVDAYIGKAALFAQPVLRHLRALIHQACPDVVETIKWSFPHFLYKDDMLCSMAAFTSHIVFSFWKAPLMKDPALMQRAREEQAMGHLGRIRALTDLPTGNKIRAYIREAMRLNDAGVKPARSKKGTAPAPSMPDIFELALNKNKKARGGFNSLTPSQQRDYITWLNEAKTSATRQKRLQQTLEWVEAGKDRNWKYR